MSKLNLIDRFALSKETSMLHWYPEIEGLVPTPKTVFVPLPEDEVEGWMDTGIPKTFSNKLISANPFKYPVFMRTDQIAAKPSWSDTCYVDRVEHMASNCHRLIEENLMADFLGSMNPKAMVLREFLSLNTAFKAFKGMPVAREFRTFVEGGKIVCYHPYWPKETIKFFGGTKEPKNWEGRLAKISEPPSRVELAEINSMASKVSEALGGYWSVDFCRTNKGWYVTDMARGEISYHWAGCPKSRTVEA